MDTLRAWRVPSSQPLPGCRLHTAGRAPTGQPDVLLTPQGGKAVQCPRLALSGSVGWPQVLRVPHSPADPCPAPRPCPVSVFHPCVAGPPQGLCTCRSCCSDIDGLTPSFGHDCLGSPSPPPHLAACLPVRGLYLSAPSPALTAAWAPESRTCPCSLRVPCSLRWCPAHSGAPRTFVEWLNGMSASSWFPCLKSRPPAVCGPPPGSLPPATAPASSSNVPTPEVLCTPALLVPEVLSPGEASPGHPPEVTDATALHSASCWCWGQEHGGCRAASACCSALGPLGP